MNSERLTYDVAVVGAGPGGYICAIRASQLGFKVCCIDNWLKDGKPALGGTCTNVGCIPSKCLLKSTELFEEILHAQEHGISVEGVRFSIEAMQERKDRIVSESNQGIQFLFRKNKVDFYLGTASFASHNETGSVLNVIDQETIQIHAKHVVLATGSRPREFPDTSFDEDRILSNTGALALRETPKTLGIIGSGVIGLEIGSVWARLGAEVRVLEVQNRLLPVADEAISKEFGPLLAKQGIAIELGVKVQTIENYGDRVLVSYVNRNEEIEELWVERLLISIGRIPNTESLGAESVGLSLNASGFIEVDENCRTNLEGVWAIGDVVRGPMLAHKAEEEGFSVAELIRGIVSAIHLERIPNVIYTTPEVAWVGKTEKELRESGRKIRVGFFPMKANGRARAIGSTSGFVKVISDAQSDEILGIHILGTQASEIIGQAVQALAFKASSEDLGMLCMAHPTLSEALKEASLTVNHKALNI